MLSFQYINNIKKFISRRHIGKSPSKKNKCLEKRAPHAALLNAGLTVEAALIMPLFIAAVVSVLFIIQAIQTEMRIQKALFNQIMKISGYAYYINVADMSDSVEQMMEAEYVKNEVIKEVGTEYLDNSNIVNGSRGIYVNFLTEAQNGILDVSLIYKMKIPFNIFGIKPVKFVVRMKNHTWIGKTETDSAPDTKMVYITANGSVYHLYRDCSYIMSSVQQTVYSEIGSLRNNSGEIYRPCLLCCKEELYGNDKVFYTSYGNRFHSIAVCSNLYSSVYAVELEKAQENYRLCSKCEKRSNNDD